MDLKSIVFTAFVVSLVTMLIEVFFIIIGDNPLFVHFNKKIRKKKKKDMGTNDKIVALSNNLLNDYRELPINYIIYISSNIEKLDKNNHLLINNLDTEEIGQNSVILINLVNKYLIRHSEDIDLFYPIYLNINKLNNNINKIAEECNVEKFLISDYPNFINNDFYKKNLSKEYCDLYNILYLNTQKRISNIN